MNTLRQIEENWLWDRTQCEQPGCQKCVESARMSAELSAEIPKWERVARAADDFLGAPAGTQAYVVAADELRAALSEVRHD